MSKLRVGVIGYGVMGKNHERVLKNLKGIELVGIVEPMHDSFFHSLEDLLNLKPDYCVISAPTSQHVQVANKLIDSGIHFLVEKPVADSSVDARSLIEKSKKNNVTGAVGHIESYNSALVKAKELLNSNALGQIYQISTRRIGPYPNRIADVGVAKDLATHDFHLTSWLVESYYNKIFAQVGHKSGRVHEDLLLSTGCLENGIITSHVVNWLSPLKERKVIITGENGTFVIDTLRSDLVHYINGTTESSDSFVSHFRGVSQGNIINLAFEKKEALQVEHENFRDFLLSGEGRIVTLEEGYRALQVAESSLESAAQGTVMNL